MEADYNSCLSCVLGLEGGYTDDPNDPGGATNLGITQNEYDAWRTAQGLPTQSVELITDDEANTIYYNNYWVPMNCAALPAGLDCAVFQAGVNIGPATAVEMLQGILNVTADGVVGPATLAAITPANTSSVIAAFLAAQQNYYQSLAQTNSSEASFLDGWMNRVASTANYIATNFLGTAGISLMILLGALAAYLLFASKKKSKTKN